MPAQLIPHPPQRLQRDERRRSVGGNGHRETVDDDVLPRDAVSVRRLVDPAGDTDPALRIRRDPVFVKDERDKDAAVLADQGEYALDALFFAVDGVDHGLPVIEPHALFQRDRIGGVDLQGQGQHALELCDDAPHHGGFIDLGEADVHIEDVRAAVLLAEAFLQDILDVVVPESLLEFLLAGRIDALADDHRELADLHALREGGDHSPALLDRRFKGQSFDTFCREADMFRGCPAAAADDVDAHRGDLFHPEGELFGLHVVDGPPAFRPGEAGIRINDDRHT